ncbi:HEAT repeat domain-containing protein [Paenibacillus humicola]|uniref:HEAT repeat domain-containing protein n=1 Tax=Paenibacillus humicola TaxID=3110540 RepID=UPI00237A865C|nr:HEAT repeat domain-containing protein [Paenibacillus humicola]
MPSFEPLLLTDDQMRQFITEGYLILKTDFPAAFHQNLLQQLTEVYEKEGNPGNNLLPRIRELQKVFDHPVVQGALTSVLGPNYMLHAHRHGHYNNTPKPGGWHKDSYWGYSRMRNHHPWWAMVMYFPQDTPVQLGPTGVMPGTQNYESRIFESDEAEGEALASGEAGTFALIHYDIWHRATGNMLGQHRYMLKFEFMRTEAPKAATWDNKAAEWQTPQSFSGPVIPQPDMWEETWRWLRGEIGGIASTVAPDDETLAGLAERLADPFEPERIAAAYRLARMGREGTRELLNALQSGETPVSRAAAYGLSAAGGEAAAGLTEALGSSREEVDLHAIFALGELRELASSAVPALNRLLETGSVNIRRAVVEALGTIGEPAADAVSGLIRCLQDEDVQVRFMAGLSLSRLGPKAAAAVPQLELALEDENRYVRAHAAEALRYINTEAAKDTLIRFLLGSRWCPTTTPASTFYP